VCPCANPIGVAIGKSQGDVLWAERQHHRHAVLPGLCITDRERRAAGVRNHDLQCAVTGMADVPREMVNLAQKIHDKA
jgi:hypothetical protein